jgi:hypothetical protein
LTATVMRSALVENRANSSAVNHTHLAANREGARAAYFGTPEKVIAAGCAHALEIQNCLLLAIVSSQLVPDAGLASKIVILAH